MENRTMEYMELLMECHGEGVGVICDTRECGVCQNQGLGEKGVLLGDLPTVHSSIRFNTICHPITTLRYRLCPWHLPNSFYFQIVPDRQAYL